MGRTVQYVPISFEDFHAEIMNASGQMIADVITDIARETLDGRNANVADGVQRALGREPRDFSDFTNEAAKSGAWTQAA
ncbi:hypothetical protein [Ruegeria jejuensis]|uniref:hypothetical protein n=1 Tax=Ruegeria jejuensis TaxID=3233338 RepID=UPI00355C0242